MLDSTLIDVRPEQKENAWLSMLVTELGMLTEVSPEQFRKAQCPMLVSPVKYCSSLNEVMFLFLNTVPKSVTAAASASSSSPSLLVSQLATQRALTFSSAKEIIGFSGSISTIVPNSFHGDTSSYAALQP